MKRRTILVVALVTIGVTCVTLVPVVRNSRGVRVRPPSAEAEPPRFTPAESAALFVGVRKFTRGAMADVPYAADDAVDLAYLFALDSRVNLVRADRVVIALSGQPQKEESKQRLLELRHAGAKVTHASSEDILSLLEQQAALAGRGGILIVSLATHGFVRDGIPYILGESSLFQYPETTVSTARMFDIAARSEAKRSLIFVDACRERLTADGRAVLPDAATAAPPIALANRMRNVAGQVVFFAAAAGQYAYDDDASRNGVFTRAVIDGLQCRAAAARGVITADTLQTFVERQVRNWIRRNREPSIACAIQVNIDGAAKNLPLACCRDCGAAAPAHRGPIHVATAGSVVSVFGSDDRLLWRRDAGATIAQAAATNAESGAQKIVVATRAQRIIVFDDAGKSLATIEGPGTFRGFALGNLFRTKTPHIVSLWSTRLSIHDFDGNLISSREHDGDLRCVAIGQPTGRHTAKIVAAGIRTLVVLDPKKVSHKPLWQGLIGTRGTSIERIEIVDGEAENAHDIAVKTAGGRTLRLDFRKLVGRD